MMERNTVLTVYTPQQKLRHVIYVAMFCTIQIVLMLTPLGFVPIGPVAATTLHLPVITAGVLLGKKAGMTLGLLFGLISVTRATLNPSLTSFLFSPFAPSVAGVSGNVFSLVIAIVPRVLLGYLAALLYELLVKHRVTKPLAPGIAALIATLCHTILVLGGIALFFGDAYVNAVGVEGSLLVFLGTIILTNGIVEALLAVFVVSALIRALAPLVSKNA